jgi:DNA-binding XRE family transcriptional regulator
MDIDMNVWTSEHIKQLRNAMNLTQEAFAKMIGVTREYVNLLAKETEKGKGGVKHGKRNL